MSPSPNGNERSVGLSLSPGILESLKDLRRSLHLVAELSHEESKTAGLIDSFLASHPPDRLIRKLGGNGLAAVYEGPAQGPCVLLRADMDALPIPELIDLDEGVVSRTVSHRCGHDGHMSILAGMATILDRRRPHRGQVVLLFQPAEETGEGARLVIEDKKFQEIPTPDWSFALHNLPGFPRGQIVVKEGVFASASRGMIVELRGSTSHAAEPQNGTSPSLAAAQLIQTLSAVPQVHTALDAAAKVTVVHASLGEPEAFGTSPGYAVVQATLRSHTDSVMEALVERCTTLASDLAAAYGVKAKMRWTQEFPPVVNHLRAVHFVKEAANRLNLPVLQQDTPFPWSEDFGHFSNICSSSLLGLGAGIDVPSLHHPTYEFPDELVPIGVSLFTAVLDGVLGEKEDV